MKKKMVALFMAVMMGVGVLSSTAAAAEPPQTGGYTMVSIGEDTEIVPYADEIIMYYAINKNDGKLYQRRWNATRGYWVDPDWILVK